MTNLNLNPAQSQVMGLIDTILEITEEMGSTPPDMVTPNQALEWVNKLSGNLCRLGILEAEFESYFYRVMSEMRQNVKSKADAELNAQATTEYMVYRKIKNFRQDLYEKIQSAKRMITDTPDGRKDGRKTDR